MSAMRLLMTVDGVGGVWQYATDLARVLGEAGVETILVLLGPPPPVDQRAAARAIPGVTLIETDLTLDWLAERPEQVQLAGRKIAELACHMRADLVQLNQPALGADTRFPMPVVAAAHSCLATWWAAVEQGPVPDDFAWRVALHDKGLRAASRVVAPSHAFAQATQQAYSLAETPAVVHNGRDLRALTDTALHDFAFTAGRLWDRGKDVATLDRAAARLSVPVKAAGPLDGPHGARMGLHHAHALGSIDGEALAACLGARPVFVSCARYEPFGLAVLEAAMAGCPLVLSDIPTFRELWEGPAMFVAPGDDIGFATVVEQLIGDTSARLARGEMARAAARRFTPERMGAQMLGLYRTLVNGSAAEAAAA